MLCPGRPDHSPVVSPAVVSVVADSVVPSVVDAVVPVSVSEPPVLSPQATPRVSTSGVIQISAVARRPQRADAKDKSGR